MARNGAREEWKCIGITCVLACLCEDHFSSRKDNKVEITDLPEEMRFCNEKRESVRKTVFCGIHGFRIIDSPKQILMFQPRGAPGSIKVCKMLSHIGNTNFLCKMSLLGGESWKCAFHQFGGCMGQRLLYNL